MPASRTGTDRACRGSGSAEAPRDSHGVGLVERPLDTQRPPALNPDERVARKAGRCVRKDDDVRLTVDPERGVGEPGELDRP